MNRFDGPSSALAAQLFGSPALSARPAGGSLTDQAARWADHVLATSPLPPAYIVRKALDAVAFSLRHGLRDCAVPSKLVGVAAHQHAVEALAQYDQLPIADRPRLIVSHTLHAYAVQSDRSLQPVGRIQSKHAAWLAPLLGHGAAIHLQTVTGLDRRARGLPVTLGVNVRVSGLALAVESLRLARRCSSHGAGDHVSPVVAEASARYHVDADQHEADAMVPPTPFAIRHALVEHLRSIGLDPDACLRPAPTKHTVRALHAAHRAACDRAEAAFVGAHARRLLGHFAEGREVDPARVVPALVPVASGTDEAALFRVAARLWSVPVSRGFGRRLRYLVRDQHNGKLVGLLALGSPVFNLAARDRFVGWTARDREARLTHVMDAYVLGAVEPYASLLGGKLVGALVASAEIAADFSAKYDGVAGRIRDRVQHPTLALVTTTSALGRSSVYNRLRLRGPKGTDLVRYRSAGYTEGHGHFHIPEPVVEAMRLLLVARGRAFAASAAYGSGPNRRLRILREGLAAVGLDAALARHGVQREVFCVLPAPDGLEVLRGRSERSVHPRPSVAELGQAAVERWVKPRALRRPQFQAWTRSDTLALLAPRLAPVRTRSAA